MEKLIHSSDLLPQDLVLALIVLPDDAKLYERYGVSDLPDGWDALPSSASAISIGDRFLLDSKHLGLFVPSAIMPEATNLVINPNHPAFGSVTISVVRPFEFDSRLSK